MVILPAVDAKLGLNYTYTMQKGELVLDAGWLWVNYFDAINSLSIPANSGNFGAQGVYFGAQWHGDLV